MRAFLFVAAILGGPDYRFELHAQGGPVGSMPITASEDDFIRRAQAEANRRGEAIAVTQNGKFVLLINPNR